MGDGERFKLAISNMRSANKLSFVAICREVVQLVDDSFIPVNLLCRLVNSNSDKLVPLMSSPTGTVIVTENLLSSVLFVNKKKRRILNQKNKHPKFKLSII